MDDLNIYLQTVLQSLEKQACKSRENVILLIAVFHFTRMLAIIKSYFLWSSGLKTHIMEDAKTYILSMCCYGSGFHILPVFACILERNMQVLNNTVEKELHITQNCQLKSLQILSVRGRTFVFSYCPFQLDQQQPPTHINQESKAMTKTYQQTSLPCICYQKQCLSSLKVGTFSFLCHTLSAE